MADTKVSDLTSATPVGTDLLYLVDDPGGTPLSKKTTVADVLAVSHNAATVTVADAGGDTTTFPMLAGSATGDLGPLTDAGLTYNATTNALTATTFVGALTGNADTATEIEEVLATTNATASVVLVDNTLGAQGLKHDAGLTYDATANDLTVGNDLNLGGDLVGNGTGMTIYGGDGDGERLTLQSNSADAGDWIYVESPLRFYPSSTTFDSSNDLTGLFAGTLSTNTYTITATDGFGPSINAVLLNGTWLWESNPSAFGAAALFNHQATHKNPSGEARTWQNFVAYADQPTYQTDTQTGQTWPWAVSYFSNPTVSRINMGSATMTLLDNAQFKSVAGASCTITTRTGLKVTDATGSGTVTTQIGVGIEHLDKSTNRTAILLGGTVGAAPQNDWSNEPSGSWGIYDTSADNWFCEGKIFLNTDTGPSIQAGTLDPSAGGGVAATMGSIYQSTNGNVYRKSGAGNTAWTAM